MVLTDKQSGTIALIFSVTGLLYLFFILMIIPILPLDEKNPVLKYSPMVSILVVCGALGLLFIGSLSAFTIFAIHKSRRSWMLTWKKIGRIYLLKNSVGY